MKAKTARRLLRKYSYHFASQKLDKWPSKKSKRLYRNILGVLRLDVRNTKNPASIRILNQAVNI